MKQTDTDALLTELEQQKAKLRQSTDAFKSSIEGQISNITDNAIRYTLRGVVFVGVAALSFFAFKFFTRKAEEEIAGADEHAHRNMPRANNSSFASNPLVQMILSNIATFLLSIAKEQLLTYLDSQLAKNRNEQEQRTAAPAASHYS